MKFYEELMNFVSDMVIINYLNYLTYDILNKFTILSS